jgi:hypothetical protein
MQEEQKHSEAKEQSQSEAEETPRETAPAPKPSGTDDVEAYAEPTDASGGGKAFAEPSDSSGGGKERGFRHTSLSCPEISSPRVK